MGFVRKLFGLECRYLGTIYCFIGNDENFICACNRGINKERVYAGCVRDAEKREKEGELEKAKSCID